MINLTRLNDKQIFINPDLIDNIETHPDTTITFTNGNKLSVKDKPEEIVNKIIDFRARIAGAGKQYENK
ncbi:MAG: hypothetical protein A2252_04960 [Elusimicrobia bacterium RIFOXYA2_FULL_39_19]|nr:MAG: hypothetical protein A2252_04960 [Elusimicrobia bacterium RIFOXYA2_FULL_39_19]